MNGFFINYIKNSPIYYNIIVGGGCERCAAGPCARDVLADRAEQARAKRSPVAGGGVPVSPEKTAGRSRARPGVSQSQPTSRSSSPSSRSGPVSLTNTRRRPSGIPRSSRSHSVVGGVRRRDSVEKTTRPPVASLRLLQQSREAELRVQSRGKFRLREPA
ncbi:unnamed protein product [Leptidea sinapis]|uniref:Uncharacterized protein n=1 Tax=Leptidea sinapis TaxID=189913 RepID=A0A5E4QSM8_9NEOP|nr:unnamed protein product [Leptidea sinapis]